MRAGLNSLKAGSFPVDMPKSCYGEAELYQPQAQSYSTTYIFKKSRLLRKDADLQDHHLYAQLATRLHKILFHQQPCMSSALSRGALDEGPELLNGTIVRAQGNLVKLDALDGLMYEVSKLQRREWSENVPDRYL